MKHLIYYYDNIHIHLHARDLKTRSLFLRFPPSPAAGADNERIRGGYCYEEAMCDRCVDATAFTLAPGSCQSLLRRDR